MSFCYQIFSIYIMSFLTKSLKSMLSFKEAISQSSVMVVCRRCEASAQSDFPSILRSYQKYQCTTIVLLHDAGAYITARRHYQIQLVLYRCCHSKGNRCKRRSAENGRTATDVCNLWRWESNWRQYHLAVLSISIQRSIAEQVRKVQDVPYGFSCSQ